MSSDQTAAEQIRSILRRELTLWEPENKFMEDRKQALLRDFLRDSVKMEPKDVLTVLDTLKLLYTELSLQESVVKEMITPAKQDAV